MKIAKINKSDIRLIVQKIKGADYKKIFYDTRVSAVTLGILLFVTILSNIVMTTFINTNGNEKYIVDWKYVTGNSISSVEGNNLNYIQASSENPVSKPVGDKYVHLNYVLEKSDVNSYLLVSTDNNPIKINVDSVEVLNNGFSDETFTGNSSQKISLPSSDEERTVDIYIYAPASFSIQTQIVTDSDLVLSSSNGIILLSVALGILFCGIFLVVLSISLASGSKSLGETLLLAFTVVIGGIASVLYAFCKGMYFYINPFVYALLMLFKIVFVLLIYANIISMNENKFKNFLFALPSVCLCIVMFFVRTEILFILTYVLYSLCLCILSFKTLLSIVKSSEQFFQKKVVFGLLIYISIISIYNSVGMVIGSSMISDYLFIFVSAVECMVIFVITCKLTVFKEIKNKAVMNQIKNDSKWIQSLSDLSTEMSTHGDEKEFLNEVAKSMRMMPINNLDDNFENSDIKVCIGIVNDGDVEEVYRDEEIETCNYGLVSSYMSENSKGLMIGETTIDMNFDSDDKHNCVIHFEGIIDGVTENVSNIIKAVYFNLLVAYRNLNLNNDIKLIRENTFIQLASLVEQRSTETKKHQFVVSQLTYELCLLLGMDEERAKLISIASIVHDIGKVAVSDAILNKSSNLTKEEYDEMKMHTTYGYNILCLQKGEFFRVAALIALQHHENYDGSGYNSIKGEEITQEARIVHIVDVFDALMSKRCYKDAWDEDKAINYISEKRGTIFDPVIADVFLQNSKKLIEIRKAICQEGENEIQS